MNRGSKKWLLRLFIGLCCCSLWAPVWAEPPLRVILLADPSGELARRVRGHTSDLGVEVEVEAQAQPLDTEVALLEYVRERGAQALVWVSSDRPGDHTVFMFSAKDHALSHRPFGGAREDSSALMEVAALVIRSELRELLSPEHDEAVATPENAGQATGADASVAGDAASESARAVVEQKAQPPRPWQWELGAGLRAAWLGDARLTWLVPLEACSRSESLRLLLGVSIAVGTPSTRTLDGLDLRLREDRFAARVGYVHPLSPDLQIRGSVALGFVLLSRRVRGAADGLNATADTRALSAFAAPRLDLAWSLTRALSLSWSLGADVLMSPVRYLVQDRQGQSREIERLLRVHPWAAVGLSFRLL